MIRRRQWLIIALCFCAFTGCVSCQSNYDYCGPMPDEGGDFMYRKNSILGGDPSMPLANQSTGDKDQQADETESGPEPTPAPPPDEMPAPGMDEESEEGSEMLPPDGESQGYEENADEESDEIEDESVEPASAEIESNPASTLQWHAPSKKQNEPAIRQVRFR
jgi:hypothetical protein